MHWQQLLDVTSRFNSDGAYEQAMQDLEWHSPRLDMDKNIRVFESFLGAWHSLRGGSLDRETLSMLWIDDIEPYAKALEGEFLEDVDIERVVEIGREKLRVALAIEHMYRVLVTVPAVGETNTSKLLHLGLSNLFVMTDTDVRQLFEIFQKESFSAFSYTFNFPRKTRTPLRDCGSC